jgi:hypothetical protein
MNLSNGPEHFPKIPKDRREAGDLDKEFPQALTAMDNGLGGKLGVVLGRCAVT